MRNEAGVRFCDDLARTPRHAILYMSLPVEMLHKLYNTKPVEPPSPDAESWLCYSGDVQAPSFTHRRLLLAAYVTLRV